jgi:hypothetical protein
MYSCSCSGLRPSTQVDFTHADALCIVSQSCQEANTSAALAINFTDMSNPPSRTVSDSCKAFACQSVSRTRH